MNNGWQESCHPPFVPATENLAITFALTKITKNTRKETVSAFPQKRLGVQGKTLRRFSKTTRRFPKRINSFPIFPLFLLNLSNYQLRVGGRRKRRWQECCHPFCVDTQRIDYRWQECKHFTQNWWEFYPKTR